MTEIIKRASVALLMIAEDVEALCELTGELNQTIYSSQTIAICHGCNL